MIIPEQREQRFNSILTEENAMKVKERVKKDQ